MLGTLRNMEYCTQHTIAAQMYRVKQETNKQTGAVVLGQVMRMITVHQAKQLMFRADTGKLLF